MTRGQLAKLHTVLAKLEALENTVEEREIRERLRGGKNELLRALTLAERGLSAGDQK